MVVQCLECDGCKLWLHLGGVEAPKYVYFDFCRSFRNGTPADNKGLLYYFSLDFCGKRRKI